MLYNVLVSKFILASKLNQLFIVHHTTKVGKKYLYKGFLSHNESYNGALYGVYWLVTLYDLLIFRNDSKQKDEARFVHFDIDTDLNNHLAV